MDILHPTYGTLDELLAEIKQTIEQGQFMRIGHTGALAWFSSQHSGPTPLTPDAAEMPDDDAPGTNRGAGEA